MKHQGVGGRKVMEGSKNLTDCGKTTTGKEGGTKKATAPIIMEQKQ